MRSSGGRKRNEKKTNKQKKNGPAQRLGRIEDEDGSRDLDPETLPRTDGRPAAVFEDRLLAHAALDAAAAHRRRRHRRVHAAAQRVARPAHHTNVLVNRLVMSSTGCISSSRLYQPLRSGPKVDDETGVYCTWNRHLFPIKLK